MENIMIISTGGTFNKYYDHISGRLEIDRRSNAIKTLSQRWMCRLDFISVIGKDSLDMKKSDRRDLLETIEHCNHNKIIVIHGTDTMEKSAKYIAKRVKDKIIVFTGAMVPFGIDNLEATANFASAYGFALAQDHNGVYISMNGIVDKYEYVTKDKALGKFISKR